MKIFIGADHRGVEFKSKIKDILKKLGYSVEDLGTDSSEGCDYPVIAQKVSDSVVKTKDARGILVCNSGIGQSMAANKVNGILAALCYNTEAAKLSRLHNNANVLVLSAMFVNPNDLEDILKIWLNTAFEGGRHERRIKLIEDIEDGKRLY
ncbi:MAG: ribose 5-phosphate isomerase B [Candidatus Omnitrophica bacterium]|nr:ribose 5-phosphate isomerase B [Candidatus Omnitrophota bacterium]